jgi:predicted ATP-grasp superfamily ATP-dependent carboligase
VELKRILIAGASTRAAAESAAKAGFEVTAIDAFGDLDQHPAVRSVLLPHDVGFTAHAAALASHEIECDAVAYLSPFDNHPRAVASLAAGPSTSLRASRVLWGNPPDVLRRVRDPFLLAGVLRRQGFSTPITRIDVTSEAKEWLLKPYRSGGGQAIRLWSDGTRVPESHYAQEKVDGIPASIVFAAAQGRAVPLGVSYQLIGDEACGASGYRYCGNVLAPADDPILNEPVSNSAADLARRAAAEFSLVGLNGIDLIIRDGTPYAVEVNPRWSSSMELVERAYGVSMFGIHAAACVNGVLPAFDLMEARRGSGAAGKAIAFARDALTAGATTRWLDDETVRDIPKPGERIAAGQPVCTVFDEAANVERCLAGLRQRAQSILSAIVATAPD